MLLLYLSTVYGVIIITTLLSCVISIFCKSKLQFSLTGNCLHVLMSENTHTSKGTF